MTPAALLSKTETRRPRPPASTERVSGSPPSLVCNWNAAVLVNCGGFAIEALSHLNGCG